MDPRLWRRSWTLCLIVLGLLGASIAIAGGGKGNDPPDGKNGNGDAEISGEFSDECRDFEADSSKDISHVEIHYADGRVEKDEGKGPNSGIDGRHYEKDGGEGDEIDHVIVKSGKTSKRFDCDDGGGPGDTECSDQVNNDPQEDEDVDAADDGCHTDGDADDGDDTYDPTDDSEFVGGGGGGGNFTCRASALRIEGSPLNDILGEDPFEPFAANAADEECVTDDQSLVNERIAGAPGALTLKVLHATTSDEGGANAEAGVAQVLIEDATGADVVKANVVGAEAAGRCNAGGDPVLTSSSEVVGLYVMGSRVPVPTNSHVDVPLGPLGTLHVNETIREPDPQTADEGKVTQRALWLDSPVLGDIIVAEAIADFEGGNPC